MISLLRRKSDRRIYHCYFCFCLFFSNLNNLFWNNTRDSEFVLDQFINDFVLKYPRSTTGFVVKASKAINNLTTSWWVTKRSKFRYWTFTESKQPTVRTAWYSRTCRVGFCYQTKWNSPSIYEVCTPFQFAVSMVQRITVSPWKHDDGNN